MHRAQFLTAGLALLVPSAAAAKPPDRCPPGQVEPPEESVPAAITADMVVEVHGDLTSVSQDVWALPAGSYVRYDA